MTVFRSARCQSALGVIALPGVGGVDVFTPSEGDVVLWPERLSAESYKDLKDWMNIILRKIERNSGPEDSEAASDSDPVKN